MSGLHTENGATGTDCDFSNCWGGGGGGGQELAPPPPLICSHVCLHFSNLSVVSELVVICVCVL